MKNIFVSAVTLAILFLYAGHTKAQVSKIKEFEAKPFYKTIFSPDAFEQLAGADVQKGKAEKYMNTARGYNREISDLETIAQNTRDDDARIGSLKKAAKLKKKRLKQLKKAYKYYTKSHTIRYKAYQSALPTRRLSGGDPKIKNYGFKFEKTGTHNMKEAGKKRDEAKYLKGEDQRVAYTKAYNYEVLGINSLIDALRLYYKDSTLVLATDSSPKNLTKDIKGFYFTVNVGMFNQAPDSNLFRQITPVFVDEQEDGILSYNAGVFKTYKDADNAQKELAKEGFDGAFVTAYENGMKMELDRAIQLSSVGAVNYAVPRTFKIGNRVINEGIESSINKVTVTKIDTTGAVKQGNVNASGDNGNVGTGSNIGTQSYRPTAKKLEVYESKEAVISARLKLSNAEMSALYEASQQEKYADGLQENVEKTYEDIKLFKEAERLETSPAKKEEYRDKHITLQMKVFVNLVKSSELYLEINETRYKIYRNHLPRVRAIIESPAALRGKEYEEIAEAHYQMAKIMQADAMGLEYQSDKYLKLMEANDQLLLAIENQETAFSLYFNLVSQDDLAHISKSDVNPAQNGHKKDLGKQKSLKRFIVTEIYVYSKISPKPKRVQAQKGIIFKIQFGLFKDFPKDNFGNITPITVEKLKNLDYSRFLVGNFKTWEAAKEALPIIKSKGYKTAFIVAMKDGKRIRPTAARHLARQTTKNYNMLVNEELALVKGKKSNAKPVKLGKILATDLSKTSDLIYTVQLGVFNRVLSPKELKTTDNINFERLNSGAIRYTKGIFREKKNADKERNRLKELGFKGVFVVAFINGKQVKVRLIENSSNIRSAAIKTEPDKKSLIFKLQVAVLSELSPTFQKKMTAASKNYHVESTLNTKGQKVVTIGDFDTYDNAKNQQPRLKNYGFEDSFIVAFKNGKQIPISLARKMQK